MVNTVVIAGGGVAGLTAAAELRATLPSEDRIILIDRSFTVGLGLSALWVLRGWRSVDEVVRPMDPRSLPGVELLTGTISHIDPQTRTVHLDDDRSLTYDALLLALGAALDEAAVPGLPEALDGESAFQFYTPAGAAELHSRLGSFDRGRLMVLVASAPYRCPAAPYEAAFLMADMLGDRFTSGSVAIDVYSPDPLPMPVAGETVGRELVRLMDQQGIRFHGAMTTTHVDPASRTVHFSDDSTATYDLAAAVPPHVSPLKTILGAAAGTSGWVPVESGSLATSLERVWAVGDVTSLPVATGKPLPKAAVFARAEAVAAAHQITRALRHDAPDTRFDGHGGCYVEVGNGLAAKGEGDFLATPSPRVVLSEPSSQSHEEKEQEERDWLRRWTTQ